MKIITTLLFALGSIILFPMPAACSDWPQWRHDAQRSNRSAEELPKKLHVQWRAIYPTLRPAFRSERLAFDRGYEPVASGNTLVFASNRDDSITALDLSTGAGKWRFVSGGPMRFAPTIWRNKVFAGSDDGHLYCLDLKSGKLHWKFRAVPSSRKILGNGRMISVWPVRGGPVIEDGRVYFAAGVWSFEGTFVYALDAATGNVLWVNDRSGNIYGQHPHGAEAYGGLTPQGYLVVDGDELIVPCGTAYPARFDRKTGELKSFALPKQSRLPGGWFAYTDTKKARDVRHGRVTYDREVNRERHEDNLRSGWGSTGGRSRATIGSRLIDYNQELPGLNGKVHSVIAANGKLVAVSKSGEIACLGAEALEEAPRRFDNSFLFPSPLVPASALTKELLRRAGKRRGFALILGGNGKLAEEIVSASALHCLHVQGDEEATTVLRARLADRGLYGTHIAAWSSTVSDLDLPPYFAELLIIDDRELIESSLREGRWPSIYEWIRPHGGVAALLLKNDRIEPVLKMLRDLDLPGAALEKATFGILLRRVGALPGSSDYLGDWSSSTDELVKAPMGVLWFDDQLGHFKRSPQPIIQSGVMISRPKAWHGPRTVKGGGYALLGDVFSDIYTGRVFAANEISEFRGRLTLAKKSEHEPSQYRPPSQKDAWKPGKPRPGTRVNPLTGVREARTFPKSYGCDGGFDYGNLFTMRSGTAAFYDKTMESGTINISGPRSGCTNSVIPAGGVLSVPYFYEGCTCSYPLPSGLALVRRPEQHEQWMSWGRGEPHDIRRIGINFGAPGDRMTREGTLWLEYPAVGGPSPTLAIESRPEPMATFYGHSIWMQGGEGWSWVAASGVEGLERFSLRGIANGSYLVRMTFSEPGSAVQGERVFDVRIQGATVLEDLDIVKQAAGSKHSIVKEWRSISIRGQLLVELVAKKGRTLLCGLEILGSPQK